MDEQDENLDNVTEKKRSTVLNKIQKAEFFKALMKLKQREYILEKGLADMMDNMNADTDIIKCLLKEEKELSTKREDVLSTLNKTLIDIENDLKSAKSIVFDPKKLQTLDINEFKIKLIKLSKKMDDFKKVYSLQTLIEEGNKLDSEVKEFTFHFDKYDTIHEEIKSSSMMDVSSFDKEKNKECEDYEEVQDFHALVAKTGHTQNWSNEDHLLFLKMRNKCKNVPALVRSIQTKCPDLPTEKIIDHEAWYKLYLDLREKQKLKVKEWRNRKEMNKAKAFPSKEIIDKENQDDNIPIGVSKNFAISKSTNKLSTNLDDTNDSKKELIKKWKLEKESKRAMEEEESKLRYESRRAVKEKLTKMRMEQIQETLRDYKNKKSEEAAVKMRKDLTSPKRYDPALVKEFRKQDEEYVRKRKLLLSRTSKTSQLMTVRKFPKNASCSTLSKPTKAWNEKCKIGDPKTKDNQKLRYIKDVPKLHTRWRNEESRDLQSYFVEL